MKLDESNDFTSYRESRWNEVWQPSAKVAGNNSEYHDYLIEEYLPFARAIENRFETLLNYKDHSQLYRNYLHASTVAVVLYLILLFGGQKFMQSRKPFNLKWSLAAWNLLLAVYSLLGTLRLLPHLIYGHLTNPAAYFVCRNATVHSIETGVYFWISLFIFSKYAELIDTAFLVLRKKPVSFLHSFHHATVLAYTWHSMAHQTNTGIYFAGMNYFVHAVMYFYYFLAAVRKPPNWGLFVTLIQLAQMFIGIGLNVFQYVASTRYPNCDVAWRNIYAAVIMYSAYMSLFVHFFYDKYCRAGSRSSGRPRGAVNGKTNGVAKHNGDTKANGAHNGTHDDAQNGHSHARNGNSAKRKAE